MGRNKGANRTSTKLALEQLYFHMNGSMNSLILPLSQLGIRKLFDES